MAGGPEAWPEPIERAPVELPPTFSWTGVFPSLRILGQSGDPLKVYGDCQSVLDFARFFGEETRNLITASRIFDCDQIMIPPRLATWTQPGPETWRYPGGVVTFYTPDGELLFVLTTREVVADRLRVAGAVEVEPNQLT